MHITRKLTHLRAFYYLSAVFAIAVTQLTSAGEFPAQGRLYAAVLPTAPANINADLSAAGLKTFENYYQGGVEITYPLHRFLNVGLRYSHRLAYSVESPSNPATEYYGGITQDVMLGVARLNAIKGDVLRLDGFVGVGGGKSAFYIKTDTQDGSLAQSTTADYLASPIYSYGVSVGVGYKNFFFYVEGGYEKNSVTRLKPAGTITSSATTLALSGNYLAIGLMFDGIKAHDQ